MVQLLLQVFRASTDDDFLATQQRWNKIGKCFTGTSSGLYHQLTLFFDRTTDGFSHVYLWLTSLKTRNRFT